MNNTGARFEWDERKRLANIEKHGIDFFDAKEIWQDDVLDVPSPQREHSERRFLAYGLLDGRVIAVVYVWRGDTRRIISARRTRSYERKAYKDAFGRGA